MRSVAEFWKWLWGDWGKSSYLTALGIPRLIIDLLGYLLGPYVLFLLTTRSIAEPDKEAFRLLVSNPFILTAYGIFYLTRVTHRFLEADLKGRPREEQVRVWQNYRDPFVTIF